MKALSIRAPWWWWILHGGKDVENRDWSASYRGEVLIHASSWWSTGEVQADWDFCRRTARAAGGGRDAILKAASGLTWRDLKDAGGHIVGKAVIDGCDGREFFDTPWAVGGRWCFHLVNPVAFESPIPCKGRLGLFNPPADVLDAINRQGETV